MATKEEVRRRRALIESAIREKGWSLKLCSALAKRLGVSPSTIRRDKDFILSDLALDHSPTPQARVEFLLRLRTIGQKAADAGRFSAAINAMRLEADVMGHKSPMVFAQQINVGTSAPAEAGAEVRSDWKSISESNNDRLARMLRLERQRLSKVEELVAGGLTIAQAEEVCGRGYAHAIAQASVPAGIATDKALLAASADGGQIKVQVVAPAQATAPDGGIFAQPPVGSKQDSDDEKEEGAA